MLAVPQETVSDQRSQGDELTVGNLYVMPSWAEGEMRMWLGPDAVTWWCFTLFDACGIWHKNAPSFRWINPLKKPCDVRKLLTVLHKTYICLSMLLVMPKNAHVG